MGNKEEELEKIEVESRIDYHIHRTRQALKPGALYATLPRSEVKDNYSLSEFGFSNPNVVIVRRFLWLVVALMALYVAKGVRRLIKRS